MGVRALRGDVDEEPEIRPGVLVVDALEQGIEACLESRAAGAHVSGRVALPESQASS